MCPRWAGVREGGVRKDPGSATRLSGELFMLPRLTCERRDRWLAAANKRFERLFGSSQSQEGGDGGAKRKEITVSPHSGFNPDCLVNAVTVAAFMTAS